MIQTKITHYFFNPIKPYNSKKNKNVKNFKNMKNFKNKKKLNKLILDFNVLYIN